MTGAACRTTAVTTVFAVVATAFASAAEITREQGIECWREARLGMVIHWGLYAIPGGTWKGNVRDSGYPEWIMTSRYPMP